MDYATQPLIFKVRKAARYVRLYGPSRTLVKVRSQYHMNRTYKRPPALQGDPGQHVGLIGAGKFAYAQIAYYLTREHGQIVRGVMDLEADRAYSLASRYGAAYASDDAERILTDPQIDLVYVASNHSTHADYAIRALEEGKHVHIEKPHVVTPDQLERLVDAMDGAPGRVSLGFNRPYSRIGSAVRDALAAESGPAMLNWFIAGHEIPPDHWYFRPEEGGRVLGNLCHWTDFSLQCVPPEGRFPIEIRPTTARDSDNDIAVTYVFGDGSVAAITFSAKGHAFEGVKERFAGHRGDTLITLDDFQHATIERGAHKQRIRQLHRDHGHKESILAAYGLARPGAHAARTADAQYVWETGELFLRTREALESGRALTLTSFADRRPRTPAGS